MSDTPYSPLGAVRRVTRSMNRVVKDATPATDRPLTLSSTSGPMLCAVLLRSFTEGGPVPDDFHGVPRTADGLKSHVRPDGAVYLGAFEVQGQRASVVIVYGPKDTDPDRAESIATQERAVLQRRHNAAALGPFANHSANSAAVSSPTTAATSAGALP